MNSPAYQLYSSYRIGPSHQGQQQHHSPPPQFRPAVLTPPPVPRACSASYYHGRHIERTPSPYVQRFPNNKKKVTFKPTCTVRTHTEVKGPLTKDELSMLYYSRRELQIMNLEARAICTLTQELPEIQNRGTLLTEQDRRYSGTVMAASRPKLHRRGSWLGLDEEGEDNHTPGTMIDTLRGLELIMYPKRKQNKLLAHRSLLKYQQQLKSKPNFSSAQKVQALAVASEKLNLWSSLVALETARLDALRAYDGDYLIPIEPLNPNGIPPCRYHKNLQDKVFEKHDQNQQIKRQFGRRGSRRVTFDATDSNKNTNNSVDCTWNVDRQQQSKRRKIV